MRKISKTSLFVEVQDALTKFVFVYKNLQLQTIVVEDTCVRVTELYQQEQTREGAGGNSATQVLRQEEEISYQKKAELLLSDENCYKFIVVSIDFIFISQSFIFLLYLIKAGKRT